jgi:hypothetical protein
LEIKSQHCGILIGGQLTPVPTSRMREPEVAGWQRRIRLTRVEQKREVGVEAGGHEPAEETLGVRADSSTSAGTLKRPHVNKDAWTADPALRRLFGRR